MNQCNGRDSLIHSRHSRVGGNPIVSCYAQRQDAVVTNLDVEQLCLARLSSRVVCRFQETWEQLAVVPRR